MIPIGSDGLALAWLVFLLGVRHGFDPDHLVAIDGLVRSSVRLRPRLARWSGLFFSLGHGVVVTLVGVAVALAAADWQAPRWLEHVGAWISIGVLLALGMANLMLFARTPGGRAVPLAGVRGGWWAERLARASHPVWAFALALGIVFTLGMVLTDALNGWWVAHLVSRADRRAAIASRCMSIAIAALCLLLAAGGFARYLLPAIDDIAVTVSAAAIVVVLAAYALANRLALKYGTTE